MLVLRLVPLALVALLAGSLTSFAQEATPIAGFNPTANFPAHVMSGTCAEPEEVEFDLSEGGFGLPLAVNATPEPVAATYVGPNAANPAIVSVTTLDVALARLVADGYVIDAHSANGGDEAATRLVCGAVGGFLSGGDLVFGLQEENASGYRGAAWLHDNSDGTTGVTLMLVSPYGSSAGVEQEATTANEDTVAPDAVPNAEPLAPLPPAVETTGLVVESGAFAAVRLSLLEDVPTVLHLVNADDQDYRFRIDPLVTVTELPANNLSVIEFTTPTSGTYEAQLLAADGNGDTVLATIPVVVGPVPGLVP